MEQTLSSYLYFSYYYHYYYYYKISNFSIIFCAYFLSSLGLGVLRYKKKMVHLTYFFYIFYIFKKIQNILIHFTKKKKDAVVTAKLLKIFKLKEEGSHFDIFVEVDMGRTIENRKIIIINEVAMLKFIKKYKNKDVKLRWRLKFSFMYFIRISFLWSQKFIFCFFFLSF